MVDGAAKCAARSEPMDWCEKFEKESKVNQELGRRLRETKRQLVEEKALVEQFRSLLDGRAATPEEGEPHENKTDCADCDKLRIEIARLHALVAKLRSESNQENSIAPVPVASTADAESATNKSPEESAYDNAEALDATAKAAVAAEAVAAGPNNTVQATTRGSVVANAVQETGQPPSSTPAFVPEPRKSMRRHSIAFELSALEQLPPPLVTSEQPCVRNSFRHRLSFQGGSNQVYHELSFQAFLGCQEPPPASLDALFKYAIVLAGPPPVKPRRNLLTTISERLRGADYRRTRSMPEGQPALRTEPTSTELTDFAFESPTPTKTRTQAAGSWLVRTTRAPQTDGAAEEPSPSLLSGWFSNLMANGLRGGSGAATPLSPSSALLTIKAALEPPETPKTNPTASKMLAVFPPGVEAAGVPELEGLVEICFPYGDAQPRTCDFSLQQLKRTLQERHRTFRSPDATFVLTLTSTNVARPTDLTYAICMRCPLFPDEGDLAPGDDGQASPSTLLSAQCCICLLTPFPFFNLFFKVLYGIAVLWDVKRRAHYERCASRTSSGSVTATDQGDDANNSLVRPLGLKDFVVHFHEVMERLKDMRFPPMGGWSRMVLSPGITPLSFHRPHSEDAEQERRVLLLEYAAPVLFGLLSVDQVLFLLGCLCCERKVLLVSDHVNAVSACVLALTTLLSPLQWAGPVVTVLPPQLEELLEAPVPLIAGRVSTREASGASSAPMRGVIEMHMDRNYLRMHEEDMMAYHELKLPDCDELAHELNRHAELLFQRHDEPDFPSVQQAEACELLCTRIHEYLGSLCALAVCDEAHAVSTVMAGRCSTLVAAFVEQLRQTQMFSEFRLRHEERSAEDVDDDGEYDSDTNIEDLKESEECEEIEEQDP